MFRDHLWLVGAVKSDQHFDHGDVGGFGRQDTPVPGPPHTTVSGVMPDLGGCL